MTIINSRAAFLSGTSSRIAALLSLGVMGLALPATAHAADECETVGQNPSANGNAPDSYTCTQPTYADGITYSSDGDLTVATNPSGTIQTGPNGVKLTGNGSDAVRWTSTGATVNGQGATVIDVTTQGGAIDIRTGNVRGVTASTTGAIRAVSQNGGAVSVNVTGYVGNVAAGATTIEAVSQGGNGNVSVTYNGNPAFDAIDFTQRGIVRRQNIWRNSWRKLAECGPRLGVDVKRRACGDASACPSSEHLAQLVA